MNARALRCLVARVVGLLPRLRFPRPSSPASQNGNATRREFLRAGAGVVGSIAFAAAAPALGVATPRVTSSGHTSSHEAAHRGNLTVGDVDTKRLGFDPLTDRKSTRLNSSHSS